MRYKVGDKIKVKKQSELKKCNFINEDGYMFKYCEKLAIITGVVEQGISSFYKINIDDGRWYWTDEMFEDSEQASVWAGLLRELEKSMDTFSGSFVYSHPSKLPLLFSCDKPKQHSINLIGKHKFLKLKVKP